MAVLGGTVLGNAPLGEAVVGAALLGDPLLVATVLGRVGSAEPQAASVTATTHPAAIR